MFKLLLSTVLLVAWIVVLSWAKPFGAPLPAVGPFFQPATGFWHNATGAQTGKKPLTLQLTDERGRGSVTFDADGVPHIRAEKPGTGGLPTGLRDGRRPAVADGH